MEGVNSIHDLGALTITNSPLEIIHEISLEYDISDPKF